MTKTQRAGPQPKLDYRKDYREFYLPPTRPVIIDVPSMSFAVVDGSGDPNVGPGFQAAMEALYAVSYGLKMSPKRGAAPEGYYDYTVFPLEGLWDMPEASAPSPQAPKLSKEDFIWRVMIRQPEFVTPAAFEEARSLAAKKKPSAALDSCRLETITDGLSVQMTHIGPYDDEPASFALMEDFCAAQGHRRRGHIHREIYLSDPRRTAPEKMKTVVRFFVEPS